MRKRVLSQPPLDQALDAQMLAVLWCACSVRLPAGRLASADCLLLLLQALDTKVSTSCKVLLLILISNSFEAAASLKSPGAGQAWPAQLPRQLPKRSRCVQGSAGSVWAGARLSKAWKLETLAQALQRLAL